MTRVLTICCVFAVFARCGPEEAQLKRQYGDALASLSGGDRFAALDEFGSVYAADPEYGDAALHYGRLLYFAGRYGDAEEVFEDRTDGESRYWLARSRAGLPDGRKAAIATLDDLLQEYPQYAEAWVLKAELHFEAGEESEGDVALRKTLRLGQAIGRAYALQAARYRKAGYTRQAEESVKIAKILAPDDAVVKAAEKAAPPPANTLGQTPERKP